MIHFGFLSIFALAVGIVLAAMLRRSRHDVLRLALGIAGAMIGAALVLSWVLYFFPLG
jgi:hypothetical protein